MSWKRYQNELIAVGAAFVMLGAYAYKHKQVTSQVEHAKSTKYSIEELKEVVALKKIWAEKKTTKKVEQLKEVISASKVKWSKKSKKVTASYTGLSANELNTLTTKILNLPVEVRLLDIQKIGTTYNVEFKCKW
jgi:predicted naringenin-chalcone synthase